MTLSDGSGRVTVYLESFVWGLSIDVLPHHLNAGLVGAFWVDFLVRDSLVDTSFQFHAPFLVWDGAILCFVDALCSDDISCYLRDM